jgi:hypothetical protein
LRRIFVAASVLFPALACAFAAVPPVAVQAPKSMASSEAGYRQDAARHVYARYPAQVRHGTLPHPLYAVVVTETRIDGHGSVTGVRVLRPPRLARHVGPWVVALIRGAAPYPTPPRARSVRYVETWLVDAEGKFQVLTLSEGQN